MPQIKIFQIHYSPETRASLDAGFMALDNDANERPDWFEYWPIRNYLLTHSANPDDYYGFLSPSFGAKTQLTSSDVIDFVAARLGLADIVLFSPFFDQSAFFLNQWEQGSMTHPGTETTFQQALDLIAPSFHIRGTVSTSRNTVFCNYFVATGRFWAQWFDLTEQIFRCAERRDSALGQALTDSVSYGPKLTPIKTFVIERIASAILATQPAWRAAAFNPMLLPFTNSPINALHAELAALDALKIAYHESNQSQYLNAFFRLRDQFARSLRK